jgi:hypothetical protein
VAKQTDPIATALERETPELAELRDANVRLQRQLVRAKARNEELVAAVETAARDAAVTVGRPKVTAVKVDKRAGKDEVALVHATDWQLGKQTSSYDSDVCAERILRFGAKIARITKMQRADHPVRHCVLMLGGDMVEGVGIFPGQPFEVDSSLYTQLFRAARVVEQLIVDLLATFETVHVVAEYGNHGRLGRKGDHPAQDNIDLLLYRIAAERSSSDRVTWQFGPDWHQMFSIGNYRAMLAHGDEIKSFGGNTPAFGILRKGTAWGSGVVDGFADIYLGHFHTPMTLTMPNGGQIYVTGSPESDNVYAAEFVAAKGRPSQRLHFIDPEAGRVSAEFKVWLD